MADIGEWNLVQSKKITDLYLNLKHYLRPTCKVNSTYHWETAAGINAESSAKGRKHWGVHQSRKPTRRLDREVAVVLDDGSSSTCSHAATNYKPPSFTHIEIWDCVCGIIFTCTWLRYIWVFAIANPSLICNVRAPYSAILWPRCKILRRSTQGNPPSGPLNTIEG